MEIWQEVAIITFGTFAFLGFLKGFNESNRKNAYGKATIFNLIGAFVWGDVVVFGIFWTLASVVVLYLQDWVLFLLTLSIFWAVRGIGEMIYQLNEQFATKKKNPPEKFWFYKYLKNDSVWFVYQIYWQCIAVVAILFAIYFAKMWK